MGIKKYFSFDLNDLKFPIIVNDTNSKRNEGITDLELDQFQRQSIVETLRGSRETLLSLYNLIQSLENMVLLDTIVERVILALDKIDEVSHFVFIN